jgi:hypothetical protein
MRVTLDIDTGELTKEVYTFYLLDNVLWLDSYTKFEKATKKSGYKSKGFYDRLRQRESSILESEVPLTYEIKLEAMDEFISRLSVKTWSERGQ